MDGLLPQLLGLPPGDLAERYAALRDKRIAEFLATRKGSAFRAGQFVRAALFGDPKAARWCRDNDLAIVKATATSPNVAGGVLVPEQVADDVLLLQELYSVIRREATVWPMTSDRDVVPRATSGFTASWIAEGSPGSLVMPAFDGVGLTAKKLAAFTVISNELLEDDAGDKLGRYIVAGMARGFGTAEDQAAFVGDGTSVYSGIQGIGTRLTAIAGPSKVTASTGHDTFGTLDQVDIGAAIAALPARAISNAKIYVSVVAYGSTLVRLSGASGGLIASISHGELQANYHGFPVVLCAALPTSTSSLSGQLMLAIGDMSQAVAFGSRRDLTIMLSKQRFADLDQSLIRATQRCDIVAHDLGTSTVAGAVVGLFAP